MIKFEEETIKQKLKMEIGLSDVPDMELWKHTVVLNSPVKGDAEMSLNAAEYVSKGLEEYKNSVSQVNAEIAEPGFGQSYKIVDQEVPQLKVPDTKPQLNFRTFDVGHDDQHFLVVINMDQDNAAEYVKIVESNFTFIKERSVGDMTEFDNRISYFQWHNWQARIDRPVSTGIFEMNDVMSKLNFSMEGVDESEFEQAKELI